MADAFIELQNSPDDHGPVCKLLMVLYGADSCGEFASLLASASSERNSSGRWEQAYRGRNGERARDFWMRSGGCQNMKPEPS